MGCIYDPKKATRAAEMISVECVAIFWVVNASSGEKSCLQFSIPTGSGIGGKGDVSHSLNICSRQINICIKGKSLLSICRKSSCWILLGQAHSIDSDNFSVRINK